MSSPVYMVEADQIYGREPQQQIVIQVEEPYPRRAKKHRSGYARRSNSIPRSHHPRDDVIVDTAVLQGRQAGAVWVKPGYKGRKAARPASSPRRSNSLDRSSKRRHGSGSRDKRSHSLGKAARDHYLGLGDAKLDFGGKEMRLSLREVQSRRKGYKKTASPRRKCSSRSSSSSSARSDDSEESRESGDGSDHKPLFVFLIVFTAVIFLITIFFNFAVITPFGADIGLVQSDYRQADLASTVGDINVSQSQRTQITPTGPTFSIWFFIYALLTSLVAYAQSTICRRGNRGYLYTYPVMTYWFYVTFIVNLGLNSAWNVVYNVPDQVWSAVLLYLIAATSYVCVGLYTVQLRKVRQRLVKEGLKADFRFLQYAGLNGLGLYAGWLTGATSLNLAGALVFGPAGVADATASSVGLCILGVLLVSYAITDFLALDQYTRYLVAPYVSLLTGTSGIIANNWSSGLSTNLSTANKVLIVLLLLAILSCLVAKVALLVIRHRKRPYVAGGGGQVARRSSQRKAAS